MTADTEPDRDNDTGVYAYSRERFGDPIRPMNLEAVAAVELSGTVIEHEDGRLRASTATILALRLSEGHPSVRHEDQAGQAVSVRPGSTYTQDEVVHMIAGLTGREPLAPGYYGIHSNVSNGGSYHLASTSTQLLARYPWSPPIDGTAYIEVQGDGTADWFRYPGADFVLNDYGGRLLWVKAIPVDRAQIERDLLAYYEVPRLDRAL